MSGWLDELREAVAYESGELVDPADTDHQGLFMAAARAVLDGRDVWWCGSHDSMWLNDEDGCEAALSAQVKPWREPCRMKQVRIIDIPKEGQ